MQILLQIRGILSVLMCDHVQLSDNLKAVHFIRTI